MQKLLLKILNSEHFLRSNHIILSDKKHQTNLSDEIILFLLIIKWNGLFDPAVLGDLMHFMINAEVSKRIILKCGGDTSPSLTMYYCEAYGQL